MACWAAFASVVGLAPFPDPTNPYRYFPPGEQSQKYNVFTPTLGAQWHVNDDQMLYVSFSKGFKAGGWTTRLSNPLADITDAGFGPEEAEAYELGYKAQFFDHKVQLNTAVFWTDYTGIQLQIQEGASPVSQNAGDAELKGGEIELEAILGGGFSLYLGASYIDAEYTRLITSVQGITLDSELPKTPKSKVTVSPQWDVNLANDGKLRFAVDYTTTDSMFNDAPNTALLGRPSFENLGAAIHYYSPGEKYELTFGGTNLTDDRYITVGSVNGAEGETVGTYNPPRQWYLSLRMVFE
jgi:iron complex outermembrane receptor protein